MHAALYAGTMRLLMQAGDIKKLRRAVVQHDRKHGRVQLNCSRAWYAGIMLRVLGIGLWARFLLPRYGPLEPRELLPESRSYETAILPSLGKALHIHCKAVATENSRESLRQNRLTISNNMESQLPPSMATTMHIGIMAPVYKPAGPTLLPIDLVVANDIAEVLHGFLKGSLVFSLCLSLSLSLSLADKAGSWLILFHGSHLG